MSRYQLTNQYHCRPKAELYLCDSCDEWKPAEKFQRKNNRSGRVYTFICQVCSKAAIGKKNSDFWKRAKTDPQIQLRLMETIGPEPIPIIDGWDKYNKWRMKRISMLVRLGMIPKKPFNIVEYVMRKVKYGRMSITEAEERIEDWYRGHPEDRPAG